MEQCSAQIAEKKTESAASSAEKKSNRTGFRVLVRKELADLFTGWRAFALISLMLLAGIVAQNGSVAALSEAESTVTDYVFLKLFITMGDSMYPFATLLAFLAPLIGIAFGFDAVSNEKSQGTLVRLASQPIYRDTIINAKFVASTILVFVTIFAVGGIFSGIAVIRTGIVPSVEEIIRLLLFFLYAGIYVSLWLAFSILLSVVCRHSATSAVIALAVWLFLSLFMTLAAKGIANAVYPTDAGNAEIILKNYRLNLTINRLSPYYLFSEVASTLLNPNVRALGVTTAAQYDGAVAGYLSLGQSVLLIWPHLVGLFAWAAAAFGSAYVAFMRKEIRA